MFLYCWIHICQCIITSPFNKLFCFSFALEIITNGLCMYFISRHSFFNCLYLLFLSFSIPSFVYLLVSSLDKSYEKEESLSNIYQSLIKNIDETLLRVDKDYIISYISKPFLTCEHEYLGEFCGNFTFFNMKLMNQLMLKKNTVIWTWKDNKSNQYYQFKCSLIWNFDQIDYVLIVISNITHHIESKENEVKRLTAETSLKSKIEFIASISHEIRNPLQVVNYSCENLLLTKLLNDQRDFVYDILNSNNLVSNIIDDILDISRIESGKMIIQYGRMNILDIMEMSFDLNYNEAKKKDLTIFMTFELDLPFYIESDKMRVAQILNNFFTNSIKYSNKGKIHLHASKVEKNKELFIRFSCKDEGIGISKEDSHKIFTPFQQISKNFGESKGWGLGLSICKKLSELLDGSVDFKSEFGKGSIFSLDIPMRNPSKEGILDSSEHGFLYDSITIIHSNEIYGKFLFNLFKKLNVKNIEFFNKYPNELNKDSFIIIEESLIRLDSKVLLHILGDKNPNDEKNIKLPNKISKLLQQILQKIESPRKEIEKKSILLKEKSILIVEDNQIIHKSLIKMLKIHGILNISSSYNGLEAVEKCKREFFNFIIMDVSMPLMDGIQATKEIRIIQENDKKKSIIICCTGNVFQNSKEKEKELLVDILLSKPISKAILIETLENFV